MNRAALLLGAAFLGLAAPGRAADELAFERIERGRYLAIAGDCMPCHTNPGGAPFAGGRPIETPFGTVVSPNITPDRDTGIGAWSTEQFLHALRKGIRRDGSNLYPAMPYPYYTRATPEDIIAIRTYLATIEPVRNQVQTNRLPFPFDVREGVTAWNAMNFSEGVFQPRVGRSAEWNRGAYLVEGLGHCGACHTPKNMTGGDETSRALEGGVIQGWNAPGINGDRRRGIGAWSVDDIVEYLGTGRNAWASASGPMVEVVEASTSKMTEADLRAIATYLLDQPGPREAVPTPVAADNPQMRQGAAIYTDQCSTCHTATGVGIAGLFPALRGSAQVQAGDPATLLRVVLSGVQSAATDAAPTGAAMPAFGWKLGDAEVAAVVTYIRNAWGNAAPAISGDDVGKMRDQLARRGE